jgi:hypothetical protein
LENRYKCLKKLMPVLHWAVVNEDSVEAYTEANAQFERNSERVRSNLGGNP